MTNIKFVRLLHGKTESILTEIEKSEHNLIFSYLPYKDSCGIMIGNVFCVKAYTQERKHEVIEQFKHYGVEYVLKKWAGKCYSEDKNYDLSNYDIFIYTNQYEKDWDIQELIDLFSQVNFKSLTFYVLPSEENV